MNYSCSRLSTLDIKWSSLYDASQSSFRRYQSNPYYQLIVAVDGPVRIEADDRRYTLRTGESLLLLPWEQHKGWNHESPQGTFYWCQFSCTPGIIEFDVDKLSDIKIVHTEKTELRTSTPHHEDVLILPKLYLSNQRFGVLSLFEQLIADSEPPKGYFRFHQTLLLGQILHLIASDFLEQNQHNTVFPASYMTYRKLVSHLNNFYNTNVNKQTLEKEMNRKYEYLCQVFKKYSGTTVVSYMHQLRIQRARHLLFSSDKGIGEIAEEIGFQDAFYFSRIFKKIEGLSPQHYRNKHISKT